MTAGAFFTLWNTNITGWYLSYVDPFLSSLRVGCNTYMIQHFTVLDRKCETVLT